MILSMVSHILCFHAQISVDRLSLVPNLDKITGLSDRHGPGLLALTQKRRILGLSMKARTRVTASLRKDTRVLSLYPVRQQGLV